MFYISNIYTYNIYNYKLVVFIKSIEVIIKTAPMYIAIKYTFSLKC